MDPKNLPNLDPKLREVYERVMQTPLSPLNASPNIQPSPPASPQGGLASQGGSLPPQPQTVQPQQSTPLPKPSIIAAPASSQNTFHSTQVFNPEVSSTVASPGKDALKGKTKISPVIWVLAGLVFFSVYLIFWMNVFKVSLPF